MSSTNEVLKNPFRIPTDYFLKSTTRHPTNHPPSQCRRRCGRFRWCSGMAAVAAKEWKFSSLVEDLWLHGRMPRKAWQSELETTTAGVLLIPREIPAKKAVAQVTGSDWTSAATIRRGSASSIEFSLRSMSPDTFQWLYLLRTRVWWIL